MKRKPWTYIIKYKQWQNLIIFLGNMITVNKHLSKVTFALLITSCGNKGLWGLVSSKYAIMFKDSMMVLPSMCNAGTCSMGFISRYSLECCSPPAFINETGFMSYGISFKFNAESNRNIEKDVSRCIISFVTDSDPPRARTSPVRIQYWLQHKHSLLLQIIELTATVQFESILKFKPL